MSLQHFGQNPLGQFIPLRRNYTLLETMMTNMLIGRNVPSSTSYVYPEEKSQSDLPLFGIGHPPNFGPTINNGFSIMEKMICNLNAKMLSEEFKCRCMCSG
jgi:hypothetical protein